MIRSYKDLEVCKRAYMLSLEIHKLSMDFPKYEMFELGAQIRRSTKSIVMNIAEGYGKKHSAAEFKRYLSIAIGSADEVKVQLEYCKDLGYVSEANYQRYSEGYTEVAKMLTGLYNNWKEI